MLRNEALQINTGIAVTSLSEQENPLELTLLDGRGVTLATASDLLPAQGHKALFVTEIGWQAPLAFLDCSDLAP